MFCTYNDAPSHTVFEDVGGVKSRFSGSLYLSDLHTSLQRCQQIL